MVVIIVLIALLSLPTINCQNIKTSLNYRVNKLNNDGNGLMDSAWPIRDYDSRRSGKSSYKAYGNNLNEKWRFLAENPNQPILDKEGIVYFSDTSGYLYALYPDGTIKWTYDLAPEGMIGVDSGPTIAKDGTLYCAGLEGFGDDYLYAIDSKNGNLKWKYFLDYSVSTEPIIDENGTIYFGTDACGYTNEGAKFIALNPDGTEKWIYDVEGFISESCMANDGTFYLTRYYLGSRNDYLIALSHDGKFKWDYYIANGTAFYPILDEEGNIYFSQNPHFLDNERIATFIVLNPDGTEKWRYVDIYGGFSFSIDSDGTIYGSDCYGKFIAFKPDGSIKWIKNYGYNFFIRKPTISSDRILYCSVTIEKSIYEYHDKDNYLMAFDSSNGEELWRKKLTGDGEMCIYSSPIIAEDGTIYVSGSLAAPLLNDYGFLHAFDHKTIPNEPPSMPTINGPSKGYINVEYNFTFYSKDPEGEDLFYYISWEGDSRQCGWHGPYRSGQEINLKHSWDYDIEHTIYCYSRDEFGKESELNEFVIQISKNRCKNYSDNFFIKFFLRFNRFF